MRKLSACLVAASLALVQTSATAGPERADRPDPWARVETAESSTSQGRLGVMVLSITPELRAYFGAPSDRGVLVAKVESGSPAASAGVQVGDVLVGVGNEAVDDAGDVVAALASTKPGDKVEVHLVRDKKTMSLDATITSAVASPMPSLDWLRKAFPWLDLEKFRRKGSST